jgi:class 3 adenylate cyclase
MGPAMSRLPHRPAAYGLLVAATAVLLLLLGAGLAGEVGRPYPGFFADLDYTILLPSPAARAAGLRDNDRIVGVDGGSPLAFRAHLLLSGSPVRYEVERAGLRFTAEVAPEPVTWPLLVDTFGAYFLVSAFMLAAGLLVYRQNPAARPNRYFLVYMCLWAASNVAVPDAVLGPVKWGGFVVGFLGVFLPVHGWVFFLTYPANPAREAWLTQHRVVPRLYRIAFALGLLFTATFVVTSRVSPRFLAEGWIYPAALAFQFGLAVISFPIKIAALWDTRRRAASPLVNQQTTVLLLGIALGLGGWTVFMLAPLAHLYAPPVPLALGSALVLLYPAAIAYATVRYRLFDATVVIRRSVVYTLLAGLITAAYAVAIAGANLVLAQADLTRSPWFSAAFMFVVVLAFNPLRERVRRAVDRTFFRERADYVRTLQALARSMTSLLDLEEIRRRVTTTVEAAMHVRETRLRAGPPPLALAPALAAAPGALSRYQVAADPRFAALDAAALGAFSGLAAEVVVPLRFGAEVRGLLLLGPKRSEAPYTAEDLSLLETLADQAAVALANAEAHRQVLDYARELERSLLIRTSLAKFVPQRVRELIEESPEAPSLDKREADVSVLFADITGYTRLSSTLAPEALDALVEKYFGAFLDEIVRHGGDVNETAGDGLMVIFHQSDHARAAVAAAQGIHRRACELNAAAGGVSPLAMHIGVNTGPALLGATKIEGRAGTRWTYTASGLTTNIAARLAAAASGGEIVLSETTRDRLSSDVVCEDLGLRELKNVDGAVRLFRLMGES